MVNRHRRHLLRRRNPYPRFFQPLVRNILLQRIKNHRTNVCGSWLQEVAEDIEIVFYVAKSAGGWDKSEDGRQPIYQFQILSMSVLNLILVGIAVGSSSANLTAYPRSRG